MDEEEKVPWAKYVDIEALGHEENASMLSFPEDEIVVEEKVDGGNGTFFIGQDGLLHICSRNRDLTAEKNNVKTFAVTRKWLNEHFAEVGLEKINPNYFYYFEHMVRHSITYPDGTPLVIGLDIKPKAGTFGRTSTFIGRQAKEEEFEKLGIPNVSLKGIFKAKDLTNAKFDELLETSAYYSGKPEGIVMKNYARTNIYGRQMFGKIVRVDFKELNRAAFGGLKKDHSDTVSFAEATVTEARIRKKILELTIQEGLKLERPLMKYLVMIILRDVFKEESELFLKTVKEFSTVTFKAVAAKKCLQTLDAMIAEAKVKP